MRRLLALIMLAAGLTALNQPAAAQKYSISASTCLPDEASRDRYHTVSGKMGHASSSTGTITVWCPVGADIGSGANRLTLTYRDATGRTGPTSDDGKIKVRVRKVSRTGGSFADANAQWVVNNDESTCPETGVGSYKECEWIFIDEGVLGFDFDRNFYFVQIDIFRVNTGDDVKAAGVTIE